MADIKISALPTNSATINLSRVPYTNGVVTYSVQMNTANSANTLMVRDASGNVAANTITANTFIGNGSNLTGLPSNQIQSDWNQTTTTALDFIKNKPTIPAAQVNADWNSSSGASLILNKPTIPTVPTNGLARAWGYIAANGTITRGYNITSVQNTVAGLYFITFGITGINTAVIVGNCDAAATNGSAITVEVNSATGLVAPYGPRTNTTATITTRWATGRVNAPFNILVF